MDAVEFLSRSFTLEQQIQSKLEQIESLRYLACRVTQAFGTDPVKYTRNVTSMQDTVVKITEAEEDLNRRIDELVNVKLEIGRVIDRVEDVSYRLILERRYLLFQTWEEIADALGYTPRWLQEKRQRALEAVQIVLDES